MLHAVKLSEEQLYKLSLDIYAWVFEFLTRCLYLESIKLINILRLFLALDDTAPVKVHH